MRKFLVAAVLSLAALGFAGAGTAEAGPGHGGHHHGPRYGYFGNGAHDLVPHWHQTVTPFGPTKSYNGFPGYYGGYYGRPYGWGW